MPDQPAPKPASAACDHDASYGNGDGTRTCILVGCGQTFPESHVPEGAIHAVSAVRLPEYCIHERRCGCKGKLRVSAWLTLDALLRAGWTVTPPEVTS